MNRARQNGWLIPVLAAALITGLLLLLPQKLMDGYDLARMHQCYKADFRAAVLAGEWPWWNPYTALGRPFFADLETATLYPPSWLVIPCGVTAGILLIIWLHLALAIAGVRRLGEQFGLTRFFATAAGISFALSGALLGRLQAGQLQVFCVICLWPWVWSAAVKLQDETGLRPLLAFAGWLALSILAGSPQVLWSGLVGLGVLLLARVESPRAALRLGLRLAAAGFLAAGLTAVQLLPFAELVQQGNRPLHDAAFATSGSMAGLNWLTLVLPPRPWLHSNDEFNLHVGALFFLLAGAATAAVVKQRNVRGLAAAALVAFVLAAGDGTPVLPGLARWVPGFAGVRYPSRYALAGTLAVPLLAAWWLDRAAREKTLGRAALNACLGLQGATLVAGLFVQAPIYAVPAAPANEAQLRADLRDEHLPRDGAPPRVALPAAVLRANAGAQCGVSTLTGFNNPGLARTWGSLYVLAGEPPPDFHRAEVKDDVIVKLGEQQRYYSLSAVLTMPGYVVKFSPPPGPRAFLSFATRRVAGWPEAAALVRAGHDFVQEALVEQELPLKNAARAPGDDVHIVEFGRNRIVSEYRAAAPGLLVLAEPWYPGWTARIDGAAAGATIPANGWMRAVLVPAGAGRVVFEYQPTGWWLGVGATLFSWAATFGLWRWSGGRSPEGIPS